MENKEKSFLYSFAEEFATAYSKAVYELSNLIISSLTDGEKEALKNLAKENKKNESK